MNHQSKAAVFEDGFNMVADEVNQVATDKGWWENERNDGEIICLMHSELSEALEALREGNVPSQKIPDFSGVEEELADTVIRIMDYGKARNMDIAGAILAKITYNTGRAYKHGGKLF